MRKYAIVDQNIVTEVEMLDDEGYRHEASYHELVIDIHDIDIQPEVGWVLEGNALKPASATMTPDQRDLFQQQAQRRFGKNVLVDMAVDQIGARNLKLARENTPVDVATLATQMLAIKTLLEGGALKTVRGICAQLKTAFPLHADILDNVIAEITNFLNKNGF